MEKYEDLKLELIAFANEDVITASPNDDSEGEKMPAGGNG